MKKRDLIKNVVKLESKYVDLLWYARTSPENENIKGVLEQMERIEKLYPSEVVQLYSKNGEWQHGFHSGMVAALRYVLTLHEDGLELAEEDFPMLDS